MPTTIGGHCYKAQQPWLGKEWEIYSLCIRILPCHTSLSQRGSVLRLSWNLKILGDVSSLWRVGLSSSSQVSKMTLRLVNRGRCALPALNWYLPSVVSCIQRASMLMFSCDQKVCGRVGFTVEGWSCRPWARYQKLHPGWPQTKDVRSCVQLLPEMHLITKYRRVGLSDLGKISKKVSQLADCGSFAISVFKRHPPTRIAAQGQGGSIQISRVQLEDPQCHDFHCSRVGLQPSGQIFSANAG